MKMAIQLFAVLSLASTAAFSASPYAGAPSDFVLPKIPGAKPRNIIFILTDDVFLKNVFVTTSLSSHPAEFPPHLYKN